MLKILSLLILTCCIGICSYAQKPDPNVKLYLFGKDWKAAKPEGAAYIARLEAKDDTTYEWRYYRYTGPLLSVETYKDTETNIAHGIFAFYGEDGKLDSIGKTFDNRKIGDWTYYTDSGTVWKRDVYENGKLIKSLDTTALRMERDSLVLVYEQREKDPQEQEASFKNGDEGWRKYLEKNINVPDRATNLKKNGTVVIQFIVQKDGSLSDFFIHQSVEYSIDEEALRVLKRSPKWVPARQFGKMVKAYRRQPITIKTQ